MFLVNIKRMDQKDATEWYNLVNKEASSGRLSAEEQKRKQEIVVGFETMKMVNSIKSKFGGRTILQEVVERIPWFMTDITNNKVVALVVALPLTDPFRAPALNLILNTEKGRKDEQGNEAAAPYPLIISHGDRRYIDYDRPRMDAATACARADDLILYRAILSEYTRTPLKAVTMSLHARISIRYSKEMNIAKHLIESEGVRVTCETTIDPSHPNFEPPLSVEQLKVVFSSTGLRVVRDCLKQYVERYVDEMDIYRFTFRWNSHLEFIKLLIEEDEETEENFVATLNALTNHEWAKAAILRFMGIT